MSAVGQTRQFIWDWPTRLFHWALVILIAGLWWTAEQREMALHYQLGQIMLGLLVFRIYWGFAGTRTAQFTHFIKWPGSIIAYLRGLFRPDYAPSVGHNPLGGLSVLAMLLVLAAQVGLGLFAVDVDGMESGPLSRYVDFDTGREAADLHDTMFNVLLVLIGLHLAAIAFYHLVRRTNLIGPMITGSRKAPEGNAPEPVKAAPLWRLALGVVIAVAVAWRAFN